MTDARISEYVLRICDALKIDLDTISVSIVFLNIKDFADVKQTSRGIFLIRCNKFLSDRDLVMALCHEFIHVSQMLNGDLTGNNKRVFWKGNEVTGVDYLEQPHEIDARKRAREVFKQIK